MIQIPNIGCLFFLLMVALIGGSPLLVGIARLALFFFVATVLAGVVGSWYLRRRAVPFHAQDGNVRHDRFVQTMVELLVRLAEVDRSLDRREVTVIRHFFQRDLGYGEEKLLWIRDLIQEARQSTVSVTELCERLVKEYDLQARFIVIEMLGRVARADGSVGPAEAALLQEIAQRLGLGPFANSFGWQQQGFGQGRHPGAAPPPDRAADALATLGLERGASPETIKTAWRNLSKEHHPDRVAHLGEEFRRVAEERMRRINAAYDTLKDAGLAR
ncbi:MAG: TerB family tellurite resistance protein [Candidatus Binatia bacterium]